MRENLGKLKYVDEIYKILRLTILQLFSALSETLHNHLRIVTA